METRWITLSALCLLHLLALGSPLCAQDTPTRIHVVGHGWHTGLILPLTDAALEACPALRAFEGWDSVEIGWGDEGFYRGGSSISLPVALKAVFVPTPTVLHIVGVPAPVEGAFPSSELITADIDGESFVELLRFIDAAFQRQDGAAIDLGKGIYGSSRFFRAEGRYYFPRTCNVWTLQALEAAGFAVTPWAGIRTENVMNQFAEHGTTIRRFPGRSRLSVLIAAALALAIGWRFRKAGRLILAAWVGLAAAIIALSTVTLLTVNHIALPDWLSDAAAFACWLAVALVAAVHVNALSDRSRSRWRHLPPALLATALVLLGLSPL